MKIRLIFELKLLSDYHIGAGQRVGLTVDSALLRDHHGMPVLRGTTLAGLLRDGFYDLIDLVSASTAADTGWASSEARLFGEPATRKKWAYSSSWLVDNTKASDERWGAQDVARVRIDPRTRRAKAQQLFIEEEGDARLTFRFAVTCNGASEEDRKDAALLIAAARMVRHLGSTRRRGRGECRISLVEAENFVQKPADEEWTKLSLQVFRDVWLKHEPLPPIPVQENITRAEQSRPDQPKRFRLLLRLVEPALIADKSEKGNAFETLSVIPGTALIGALATRAAKNLGLGDSPNQQHRVFTEIFLRGGVNVSGLLPAQANSSNLSGLTTLWPAVPAPASINQCETHPTYGEYAASLRHGVHDLLEREIWECPQCHGKLKEVGGYLRLAAEPDSIKISKREEMHTRVDRQTGRVAEGNLYTYIMIESGQWFIGELTCQPEYWFDFQEWCDISAGERYELRLGKATQRGYGLAHMILEEIPLDVPPSWNVLAPEDRAFISQDGELDLTMLLLTDAILPDKWFRARRSIDAALLADILGETDSDKIKLVKQVSGVRQFDAFNTYRKFPGWRDGAVTAGTVIRFTWQIHDKETAIKRLHEIEQSGIGRRRHEGFGCVAFNHPIFDLIKRNRALLENNISKFRDGISIAPETRAQFILAAEGTHPALYEAEFRTNWSKSLDISQNEKMNEWADIKGMYADVARLIFLYRYLPLEEIKSLLVIDKKNHPTALGRSDYLWGKKTLEGRNPSAKVEGPALKLINDLLDSLGTYQPGMWPTGLELLAERIGDQVEEDRSRRGVE